MLKVKGYINTLALKIILNETYEPGKTILDIGNDEINYYKKNKGVHAFIGRKIYFTKTTFKI
ncbi:hypothetical protein CWO85_01165 [Candidatus Phytoplasma ziziphi]|uniref:Uncharacterized protein n=1 Tax=Ziziphus jujuba witches'-broom phytoplasma TaxID=135727 RepID=A0A660HM87_ZIZJU|nr:hypothetical protein [Candidatus Phytoplasma ziziphi]AYJ01143.1 hypothetical protein CWO85_01165 [Candidatus Phytoplasma ziziphi]